jgi:hypothetical protein
MNARFLWSALIIASLATAFRPAVVQAQLATETIRPLVDTLASPYMGGRGYVDSGLYRAAAFIEDFFKQVDLRPAPGARHYRQVFTHSVNTFNGSARLSINGNDLLSGKDFVVHPGSRGIKGVGQLQLLDSIRWIDAANRLVIEKADKLTWGVSTTQDNYTLCQVLSTALPKNPTQYEISLDATLIESFASPNIIAYVPGTAVADSFLVLTAHYDHLGKLGTLEQSEPAIFYGANDNASGLATLLAMARYLSQNPLRYSVLFIAFAGEEAGLLGSKYFTQNPLVPLKKMRFLVNLDLLGTGEEGIMVVNATEFTAEFLLLESLNQKQPQPLAKIGQRGKAANSDHYWFSEAGVPSFFIYTLGGINAYHDIYDRRETLPLTCTATVANMLVAFFAALSGTPSR